MQNEITLINAKKNKVYKIINILGETKQRRRLLDLGFVNTNIQLIKTSSLRGVFLVQLRGYVLALRYNQASSVVLEEA